MRNRMMPDNKQITSFIARSILDVSFIQQLKEKKENSPAGDVPVFLDDLHGQLDRIENFSAFIAKVHHNFLWNDFPLTRHMLTFFRMDIQVFKAYLVQHQKNRGLSKEEKTGLFISFLQKFLLKAKAYESQLVLQALQHENALYTARNEAAKDSRSFVQVPSEQNTPMQEVPCIRGVLKIVPLAISPDMIGTDLLHTKNIRIGKRRKWYCYWFSPGCSEAGIFEISSFMRSLLLLINGKNKIDFIAKSLHSKNACEDVIADLVDKGIAGYK